MDINNLQSLRQGIFQDLFGSAIKKSSQVNLFMARIDVRRSEELQAVADRLGPQQTIGTVAAKGKITSLHYSGLLGKEGKFHVLPANTLVGTSVDALMAGNNKLSQQFSYDTARRQNVVFSWDAFPLRQLSQRNLIGPGPGGTSRSGFVSVKKIARQVFGDMGEFTTNVGSLKEFANNIQAGIKGGNIRAGSSLDYLQQSYNYMGKSFQDMSPAEHTEAILNAAYLKAKSSDKLGDIRQILHLGGVRNLDNVTETIASSTDPFNIQRAFRSAMKPGSRGAFFSGGIASDQQAFLRAVEGFSGEQFAQEELPRFMEKIYKHQDSKNLSLLLSDTGSLYAGQGQIWSSYQPIPLEVAGIKGRRNAAGELEGYFGDVSEHGLIRGRTNIHGRLAATKAAVVDGRIVPASRPILAAYAEGMTEPYAGSTPRNIEIALSTGFRRARKIADNYLSATVSRGMPMTAGTLAGAYTAYSPSSYQNFNDTFMSMAGDIGGMRDITATWERAQQAIKGYEPVQGESSAFWAIKPKEKVIPMHGIEDFYLPGSLTEKEMTKGIYHRFKPQEINSPAFIKRMEGIQSALSARAGGGPIGANAIGLVGGDFRTLQAAEASLTTLEGDLTGRLGGKVVTKSSFPTLFLASGMESSEFLRNRELFGEPAIEMTDMGRSMYKNMMRPSTTLDMSLSKAELHNVLSMMSHSGELDDHPDLKRVFDTLTSGTDDIRFYEGKGIKLPNKILRRLRKAGIEVPQGADRLTYASYQDWDKAVKFGFASRITPGSISTVTGGQRVTQFIPHAGRFQQYKNIAAGVTSAETLSAMNPIEVMFQHRTQLSGFKKGGARGFANRYKKVAAEMGFDPDLINYQVSASGGQHLVVPGYEKRGVSFAEQFDPVSREVLSQMGATPGEIAGEAPAMARMFGQSINGLTSKDRLFLLHNMMRQGETEDLMQQSKAMRPRLEMVRRWGRGIEGQLGIKPRQHPLFMEYARAFERKTGLKVNEGFYDTGHAGMSNFLVQGAEVTPQYLHMKAVDTQLRGTKAIKAFSEQYKVPVLNQQEAIDIFLKGPNGLSMSKKLGQEGFRAGDLYSSALFSNDYRPENLRKGFFLELNEEAQAPLRAGYNAAAAASGKEKYFNSKYIWVPGTEKGLGKFFGMPKRNSDLNLKLASDSLEHNILGLISSFENSSGVTMGNTKGYFADAMRSYAAYSKKGGVIDKKLLSGTRMTGGATFRPVPRADMSIADAMSMAHAGGPTEDMFTVGISEKELRTAFRNDKKYMQAARETLKEQGFLWGGTFPNPFHTAAHASIVKYKLMDTLEDAGKLNEPRAMLGAFLTWKMNRDNDKDAVQALLKAGVKSEEKEAWQQAFALQVKHSASEYSQFVTEMRKAHQDELAMTGKDLSVTDFLKSHKEQMSLERQVANKFKYLSFGKTPPLSFAGEYNPFALASEFAGTGTPEEIAARLNKMVGKASKFKGRQGFTGAEISGYQKLLGSTPEMRQGVASIASLLEGNTLQAFITKGGALAEPTKDFLNLGFTIQHSINSGKAVTDEELVAVAQHATHTFFTKMSEAGKLRLQGQYFTAGSSEAGAIAEAANIYGRTLAVPMIAIARKINPKDIQSGMFDPLRQATKARKLEDASLAKVAMLAGEALTGPMEYGSVPTNRSQQLIAAANQAAKDLPPEAGSDVAKKATGWLSRNWKGVAAIAGGIVALRTANELFGSDEVDRPSLKSARALAYSNAPLPPEPMVGQPMDSPGFTPANTPTQRAFVQRPQGSFSRTNLHGSYNSVNSNDLSSAMRTSPFTAGRGNINIIDSRSYKSNWELQNIADQAGDSDFIYPGMGTA